MKIKGLIKSVSPLMLNNKQSTILLLDTDPSNVKIPPYQAIWGYVNGCRQRVLNKAQQTVKKEKLVASSCQLLRDETIDPQPSQTNINSNSIFFDCC